MMSAGAAPGASSASRRASTSALPFLNRITVSKSAAAASFGTTTKSARPAEISRSRPSSRCACFLAKGRQRPVHHHQVRFLDEAAHEIHARPLRRAEQPARGPDLMVETDALDGGPEPALVDDAVMASVTRAWALAMLWLTRPNSRLSLSGAAGQTFSGS
jgi:hypothetical protein